MRFRASGPGTLHVAWYQPAGPKTRNRTLVASGVAVYTGAKVETVSLRLTAAGRRLLSHALKARLLVKATFASAGKPQSTIEETVLLK
jgi:hypothetical protein